MKMTVFILEDNPITAQDLKEILEEHNIEVIGIANSVDDANELLIDLQPDVFIVDIKLKGLKTGIDFARQLKEKGSPPLIYITANSDSETVKQAISTAPSSFLTKPFDEKDVVIAVELAFAKYYENENGIEESHSHMFLKDGHHFEKVEIKDISYLEAQGSYCRVFTSHRPYLLSSNLNNILNGLNGAFVRIHRSYAVNPIHISKIDADHVFVEDVRLPIGRSHKPGLKDIFLKFR